jgi:hypothetical protein
MADTNYVLVETPRVPLEEWEQHAGQYVAIVDGHVAGAGETTTEARAEARHKHPDKGGTDIVLTFFPDAEYLIL